MAGLMVVGAYILVEGLDALIESESNSVAAAAQVGKQDLFGFLCLEVLDASFSFDVVIAAFALTSNIVIVAVGPSEFWCNVRTFLHYFFG